MHAIIYQSEVKNLKKKFERMKASIEWGEDEILSLEEELAKGNYDINLIDVFKKEDEDKFRVIMLIHD
jgi:hypothetical protein